MKETTSQIYNSRTYNPICCHPERMRTVRIILTAPFPLWRWCMLLPAINLIAVLFLILTLQQLLSNWNAIFGLPALQLYTVWIHHASWKLQFTWRGEFTRNRVYCLRVHLSDGSPWTAIWYFRYTSYACCAVCSNSWLGGEERTRRICIRITYHISQYH
jgi:hypothetical protein